MFKRVPAAGFPAFTFAALALVLAGIGFVSLPANAPAAGVSIINGSTLPIEDAPWQVAIAAAPRPGKMAKPRARTFCGGSLLTPDLVITAGHCVADLSPRKIRRLEIISGRTRLNDLSRGAVTPVRSSLMPLKPNGKRRYVERNGTAPWDVALLQLATPLDSPVIKLAGPDEADSWSAGALVTTTGWGVTRPQNRKASSVLRTATQVMLPDRTCQRTEGNAFKVSTMNCLGGPATHSSTCFGDSGGPLVAQLGDEPRLVGLTSFGDSECRSALPSIDTRVASDPIRSWVRSTALTISGLDVVGSGAIAAPKRTWCRVPRLSGLALNRARMLVAERGCRVSQVLTDNQAFGKAGLVTGSSFLPGWLAPVGTGVKLWVKR